MKSFLFCGFCFLAFSLAAEVHNHEHGDGKFDAFSEVMETFNKTEDETLTKSDVSSIIEELFIHKFGCKDIKISPSKCTTCLTADNIFAIVKADPKLGLNEDEFSKASVIIVTYLLDLVTRCKLGGNPGATVYDDYVNALRVYKKVCKNPFY